MQRFHSATLHHSNAQPELAIIEGEPCRILDALAWSSEKDIMRCIHHHLSLLPTEELEEGQGSREAVAEDAQHDDFVQSITAEEGPLAFYKENRLSGRYRRVRSSSPEWASCMQSRFCRVACTKFIT